jgi:hypothetical protein
MKKTPLITLFAVLVLFAGCETVPAASTPADYGPTPTGQTAMIVKTFLETRLKDAASAQYQFPETVDGVTLKAGVLSGKQSISGWRADVMVNAKNSLGGYTGWQHWAFVIRDGRVVAWNERADLGLNTWRTVERI